MMQTNQPWHRCHRLTDAGMKPAEYFVQVTVDVTENFPNECRYVLEMLGQVYLHDAEARERGLTPVGTFFCSFISVCCVPDA